MGTGQSVKLRKWYTQWCKSGKDVPDAVEVPSEHLGDVRNLRKSRARKPLCKRKRAPGAGAPFHAPLVRKALYEWWTGLRFAINWKKLAQERRSRGKKTFGSLSIVSSEAESQRPPRRLGLRKLAQWLCCA